MKEILSYIAIFLAVVGYIPYIYDLVRRKTKPHAFSWLIWGLLTLIVFFIQITNDGGLASWVAGITGIISLFIFALSLHHGEKNIKLFDWFCLLGALAAIILWVFIDAPLPSILVASLIDMLGFAPTFRKSYLRPFEETLSTQVISTIKHGLTFVSLSSYTLITMTYPVVLFVSTLVFVIMMVVRRKRLS